MKNAKNMRKTILQEYYSCSVKKTARINTKYSRNETILKIVHIAKAIAHVKAIAFAKESVLVKNEKCQKHAKNDSTRILELFCEKTARKNTKTARKNTKYSRNETILKIVHLAKAMAHVKAIAFAKW